MANIRITQLDAISPNDLDGNTYIVIADNDTQLSHNISYTQYRDRVFSDLYSNTHIVDLTNNLNNFSGIDANKLNGQLDSFYLNYANFTNTPFSNTEIASLQTMANEYVVTPYINDLSLHTTDELPEGNTNLYFSDTRFDTFFAGKIGSANTQISTNEDNDAKFANVTGDTFTGDVTFTASTILSKTSPNLQFYDNGGVVDARTIDISLGGGTFNVKMQNDSGANTTPLIEAPVSTSGATEINFYVDGVLSGKIESSGVSMSDVQSFVTAQKGDFRYLRYVNNLSDVNDIELARDNLGLGSIAVENVGTANIEFRTNAQNDGVYTRIDSSGMGTTNPPLTTNIDDPAIKAGMWRSGGSSNTTGTYPSGASEYGTIFVLRYDVNSCMQFYYGLLSTKIWIRRYYNSAWTEWEELVDADTMASTYLTQTDASNTYLSKSNNLAGLTNATTARSNLGLGSLAVLNEGTANNEHRNNLQNDGRFAQLNAYNEFTNQLALKNAIPTLSLINTTPVAGFGRLDIKLQSGVVTIDQRDENDVLVGSVGEILPRNSTLNDVTLLRTEDGDERYQQTSIEHSSGAIISVGWEEDWWRHRFGGANNDPKGIRIDHFDTPMIELGRLGDGWFNGNVTATIFRANDGDSNTPTIGFTNDIDTGFYRMTTGKIGVTLNSSLEAEFVSGENTAGSKTIITREKGDNRYELKRHVSWVKASDYASLTDAIAACKALNQSFVLQLDPIRYVVTSEIDLTDVTHEFEIIGVREATRLAPTPFGATKAVLRLPDGFPITLRNFEIIGENNGDKRDPMGIHIKNSGRLLLDSITIGALGNTAIWCSGPDNADWRYCDILFNGWQPVPKSVSTTNLMSISGDVMTVSEAIFDSSDVGRPIVIQRTFFSNGNEGQVAYISAVNSSTQVKLDRYIASSMSSRRWSFMSTRGNTVAGSTLVGFEAPHDMDSNDIGRYIYIPGAGDSKGVHISKVASITDPTHVHITEASVYSVSMEPIYFTPSIVLSGYENDTSLNDISIDQFLVEGYKGPGLLIQHGTHCFIGQLKVHGRPWGEFGDFGRAAEGVIWDSTARGNIKHLHMEFLAVEPDRGLVRVMGSAPGLTITHWSISAPCYGTYPVSFTPSDPDRSYLKLGTLDTRNDLSLYPGILFTENDAQRRRVTMSGHATGDNAIDEASFQLPNVIGSARAVTPIWLNNGENFKFMPASVAGFISIACDDSANFNGFYAFRTINYPTATLMIGDNTYLSHTLGSAGRLNVDWNVDGITIQNNTGGSRRFYIAVLG